MGDKFVSGTGSSTSATPETFFVTTTTNVEIVIVSNWVTMTMKFTRNDTKEENNSTHTVFDTVSDGAESVTATNDLSQSYSISGNHFISDTEDGDDS